MNRTIQQPKLHIILQFSLVVGICISITSRAFATQLRMSNIFVENERRFIDIAIIKYAESDIIEAIKRGIETKLTITIQIIKVNPFDFIYSKTVHSIEIHRSMKFDFWNRSYIISEKGTKSTYHNERQLLNDFFSVFKFEIPSAKLLKGKPYRVRARAELSSIELYFPMNLIFKYIVGYWDFDTGWVNGPSFMIEQ
ncbi:MAG: DUF4390 domain-containing protein [Spirochaetes bacterium]|nr:DUF4390 domain-containing protein [Spirochaetota bacterium]